MGQSHKQRMSYNLDFALSYAKTPGWSILKCQSSVVDEGRSLVSW